MSTVALPWRLARAADSRLCWVAAGELEALCAASRDAGLHCVRIGLGDCRDKAALLERFAGELAFPAWFGHNWDALADCLGDLSWLPGDGHLLVLEDCRRFSTVARRDYEALLDILAEAASEWRARGLPFWPFISMAAAPGQQT